MNKAKYTVVLKTLLDNEDTNQAIQKALSTYPLYTQAQRENPLIPVYIPTREELNKKILNYYKYHEIGFETVGRFLDELETTMNEIMVYYNQMFFSVDQDYDIRFNVDYERTHTEHKTGENTGNVSGSENIKTDSEGSVTDNSETNAEVNNYSKKAEIQTPQDLLGSMPPAHTPTTSDTISLAGVDAIEYASKMEYDNNKNIDNASTSSESSTTGKTETTGSNSVESTNTNNETVEFNERTKGNYGQVSFQSLIRAYRENIINVEQHIIRDRRIRELFMLVY